MAIETEKRPEAAPRRAVVQVSFSNAGAVPAQLEAGDGEWSYRLRIPACAGLEQTLQSVRAAVLDALDRLMEVGADRVRFQGEQLSESGAGQARQVIDTIPGEYAMLHEGRGLDVRYEPGQRARPMSWLISGKNRDAAPYVEFSRQEEPPTEQIPDVGQDLESILTAEPEEPDPADEKLETSAPAAPLLECREVDGRYVLGEPRGSFYQVPFPAKQIGKASHRSDVAADIAQVESLLIMAASLRGAMHYCSSTVRQDSYAYAVCQREDGSQWLVAAVADGVSEAPRSHSLADHIARQAAAQVAEELSREEFTGLDSVEWDKIASALGAASKEYCLRASQGKVDPRRYRSIWASTLEFVVVRADGTGDRPFACVTVAGDGAAYVLDGNGHWRTAKSGKDGQGSMASNAVAALPMDPGRPQVSRGTLRSGEALFLTTDGLSDMMGDGSASLGRFFGERFPKCENLITFLRAMDVSMFQADDDRTGILIKEHLI